MKKLLITSALSGCFWFAVLIIISFPILARLEILYFWFGLTIIFPCVLTGMCIGLLSTPVYKLNQWWLTLSWSLASLFVAAALFELFLKPFSSLYLEGKTGIKEDQVIWLMWGGLVFFGGWIVLSPLAFINHLVIGRFYRREIV